MKTAPCPIDYDDFFEQENHNYYAKSNRIPREQAVISWFLNPRLKLFTSCGAMPSGGDLMHNS